MILKILSLLLASAASLRAQVELPDIDIYTYVRSHRDPFISALAPTTLLSEQPPIAGVASGELMRRFLEKLTASIKEQLSVGGLSTDESQNDAVALINGVAFHSGDLIPVEFDDKTLRELDQLAQSFGLTLIRTPENSIAVAVGTISSSAVDFELPGFHASICQLPIEKDEPSAAVKLERKKGKKK